MPDFKIFFGLNMHGTRPLAGARETRGFFPRSLRAPVRVRGFEIRLKRCDAFQPAAVTRADYGGRKSRHNRLVGGGSNRAASARSLKTDRMCSAACIVSGSAHVEPFA